MIDLETMRRAKRYIEKMANGIDPVSDQPVADADCINQVRVSRCLFYVADLLGRLIDNGGNIGRSSKPKKAPFAITYEQLKQYPLDKRSISASKITRKINALVDLETTSKLKNTSITAFLTQCGFLTRKSTGDGKFVTQPTEQGKSIGIFVEERKGPSGTYSVVLYNTQAQQFILDNIDAVIAVNHPNAVFATQQYQPWTDAAEEILVNLFRQNVPVSEIAVTLQRTENAIRARLKRLRLISHRNDAP